MKKTSIWIAVTCLALFLPGCQHNEIEESDLIVTEGYIDVRITGRSFEDIQLDESQRFSVYPAGKDYVCSAVSGSEGYLHFSIERQNDLTGSNYISMKFDYNNGLVSNIMADLVYQKKMDSGTSLFFNAETGLNIQSSDIVVDDYNSSTGYLSGNFTFLISSQPDSGIVRNAIVDGEFYVNVRKIVY